MGSNMYKSSHFFVSHCNSWSKGCKELQKHHWSPSVLVTWQGRHHVQRQGIVLLHGCSNLVFSSAFAQVDWIPQKLRRHRDQTWLAWAWSRKVEERHRGFLVAWRIHWRRLVWKQIKGILAFPPRGGFPSEGIFTFPPWGLPKLRIFTSPPVGAPQAREFSLFPPVGASKLGNFHFSPPWQLPKVWNFHFSLPWRLSKLRNFK